MGVDVSRLCNFPVLYFYIFSWNQPMKTMYPIEFWFDAFVVLNLCSRCLWPWGVISTNLFNMLLIVFELVNGSLYNQICMKSLKIPTTQWPKKKKKDKQRSTKHTHTTKDRVTRTPLKPGGELRCSGRVSCSCSTCSTCHKGHSREHENEAFLSRSERGRFGALKSDSTHHFFRNACTKSGSLRFSQFSGCWLILCVYILMSFDFPFVRLLGVR